MTETLDTAALQLIAAIAKVVEVPVPACADAFAAISPEKAESIIENRFAVFDLRDRNEALTAAELEAALSGNSIYGAPYNNDPYVLALYPGGEGRMKVRGRNSEGGTWWINSGDDTIHSKWELSASGRDIAVRYYRTAHPQIYLHEGAGRDLPLTNWRMCIVLPGLAL